MIGQGDDRAVADQTLRSVVALLDAGDTAAALERLKPVLAVPAPSLAARFVLAMTAWKLERFDWALSLLKECHAAAPENGEIGEALASLEAQLGHLHESLFVAKLASVAGRDVALAALVPSGYPDFDHAFLSIVEHPLLLKAQRSLAAGRLAEACEQARQHVAIEPQHEAGRAFYARCLLRSKSAAAAAAILAPFGAKPALAPEHASLYAEALTAIGAREAALRWHQYAVAQKPSDPDLAAAYVADAPFLVAAAGVAALAQDWSARFALAPRPLRKYGAGSKLVVAYLVAALADPADAAAVAVAAQAHDRSRVVVLGFGRGRQTAEENASLIGCFAKWRDIDGLDPATLARIFAGEGVDVLVDCGGFASALQLQALSACDCALRLSWLGNPARITAPLYDVGVAAADYPIVPALAVARTPREAVAFGADVGMVQLDAETVGLWSGILAASPEAKLVLRARDMADPANIARLVAAFGNTIAARIDLRTTETASDFYAAVDVALLPRSGLSPRAAAEALAHGVPAVALAGEPYGAFLDGRGLGPMLVADDADGYRRLALDLAGDAAKRVLPPLALGGAALAAHIEDAAARQLSQGEAA